MYELIQMAFQSSIHVHEDTSWSLPARYFLSNFMILIGTIYFELFHDLNYTNVKRNLLELDTQQWIAYSISFFIILSFSFLLTLGLL
jgi:hypothetical protein